MATRNSQDEAGQAAALSKFEATQRGWEELRDAYMSGLVDSEADISAPAKTCSAPAYR
jgi:hypothetical protein